MESKHHNGWIWIGIFLIIGVSTYLAVQSKKQQRLLEQASSPNGPAIWAVRCIDTMKTSRDKARDWLTKSDLDVHIAMEMRAIKDMGANCVAIDTPYDDQFQPYMAKWVAGARKEGLAIWFRGNFSSWEGWFDYPKGMSTADHLNRTREFILSNKDLFQDGDIFTPAPEAENGGPFHLVPPAEYAAFRQFLKDEYRVAGQAFQQIGKQVDVSWLTMSGGLARRMFDAPTIQSVGNRVGIDHYVRSAQDLGEYIDYFSKAYGAKVIVGEWGAPIPDINGDMSEQEQADFVRELLHEMYMHKDQIAGLNYWTIFEGSTAILHDDGTPKLVVEAIKDYYMPTVIEGNIFDPLGKPIANATVGTKYGLSQITKEDGEFRFVVPAVTTDLTVSAEGYRPEFKRVVLSRNDTVQQSITLEPISSDIWYRILLFIHRFV